MLPKTTLLYLYKPKEKKILLAMKKRRFGVGKWNGVGGKLNIGEGIEQGLIRETMEEICVKVSKNDLIKVAIINFHFKNNKSLDQQSHVFFTEKWRGQIRETEEMKPKWHKTNSLPFDKMWLDDPHWLPLVLKGKKLRAVFNFNEDGTKIINMDIKEVKEL
jgi:ADP-ribose pyrophosphatase YjhB (NUDIX family)